MKNWYGMKILVLIIALICGVPLYSMDENEQSDQKEEQNESAQNDQQKEMCAICRDDLDPTDNIFQLSPCRHTFHDGCIRKSLSITNAHCPICRAVPDNVPGLAHLEQNIAQQRRERDEHAFMEQIGNEVDQHLDQNYPHIQGREREVIRQLSINQIMAQQRRALLAAALVRAQGESWARLRQANAARRAAQQHPAVDEPDSVSYQQLSRPKTSWKRNGAIALVAGIIIYLFKDTVFEYIFGAPEDHPPSDHLSSEEIALLQLFEQEQKDSHEDNQLPHESSN